MDITYEKLKSTVIKYEAYLRSSFNPKDPMTLFEYKASDNNSAITDIIAVLRKELLAVKEPVNNTEAYVFNLALIQLCLLLNGAEYIKTKRDKKFADNYQSSAVRYTASLINVVPNSEISTALDLETLIWIRNTDFHLLADDIKTGKYPGKLEPELNSAYYGLSDSPLRYGTIRKYLLMKTTPEAIGYKFDIAKTTPYLISILFNNSRIKSMLSAYANSEKYWVESAISEENEIISRLIFMNAYSNELKAVYAFMCMTNPKTSEIESIIKSSIESFGISELIKDYRTIFASEKRHLNTIDEDTNFNALEFRQHLDVYYKTHSDILTDNKYLKAFHRFILGTPHIDNIFRSPRVFIEMILAKPDNNQLKICYVIEHRLERSLMQVTDKTIADYIPDIKTIVQNLLYSQWKYYIGNRRKRINWDLVKAAGDKIYYDYNNPSEDHFIPLSNSLNLSMYIDKPTKYLGLYCDDVMRQNIDYSQFTSCNDITSELKKFDYEKSINAVKSLCKRSESFYRSTLIVCGRQEVMNGFEENAEKLYSLLPSAPRIPDSMHIIDDYLFDESDNKEELISNLYDDLDNKFRRLPDYLKEKYSEEMSELLWDEDKLSDQVLKERLGRKGELNFVSARNKIVHRDDSINVIKVRGILKSLS